MRKGRRREGGRKGVREGGRKEGGGREEREEGRKKGRKGARKGRRREGGREGVREEGMEEGTKERRVGGGRGVREQGRNEASEKGESENRKVEKEEETNIIVTPVDLYRVTLTLLLVIQTGDHAVPKERDSSLTTPAESTVTGVPSSENLSNKIKKIIKLLLKITAFYYTAGSASGQDEANPVF